MNTVAKLALVPLLLTQAHWARRRAPVLPEAEGPRSGWVYGTDSTAAPLRLLLVGDSSAAGVGVETQSQALIGHLTRSLAQHTGRAIQWRVIAKSGASSLAAVHLLDEATESPADVAVVALGVNDIVDQLPLTRALRARGALLRRLRHRFGVAHVVFAPVPPVHQFPLLPNPLRSIAGQEARALDASVARWAARQAAASHLPIDVELSPEVMAADGFHPAEPVYRHSGEALAAHIAGAVLPALAAQPPLPAAGGRAVADSPRLAAADPDGHCRPWSGAALGGLSR